MAQLLAPNKPFLVIGEGEADIAFFETLAKFHKLDHLQFRFPSDKDADIRSGGIDGYGDLLKALAIDRLLPLLRGILITADSDDKPETGFRKVTKQLKQANKGGNLYGVPSTFHKVAQSPPPNPPIIITTLPWINLPGSLETLIEEAFKNRYPEVWNCAEAYFQCVETNPGLNDSQEFWSNWLPQKRSKARLSSLIAATCKDDPAIATSRMWFGKKRFAHLIDDSAFTPLVEFFRNLESYFATTP